LKDLERETIKKRGNRKKLALIAVVIFIAALASSVVFLQLYYGIQIIPNINFPSDGSSNPETTTTTQQQSLLVPTGTEILKTTTDSPKTITVELEPGRYVASFEASNDVKLLVYKGKKFRATNGNYAKTASFKFDVGIGEGGSYELRVFGEAVEVSVLLTQTLKF